MAIASTLLVIALPAFQTQVRNGRIAAASTDLLSTLMHARAEASARSVPVTVCKRNEAATGCLTGASDTWDGGWMTFVDEDGEGDFETAAGDEIIQVHKELHEELTALGTGGATGLANFITYFPTGMTTLNNTEFIVICDEARQFSNDGRHSRAVVVSLLGKASILTVSEADLDADDDFPADMCRPDSEEENE